MSNIITKLLMYNGNKITTAFKNNESNPYFYAKQVCMMLEYKNSKKAVDTYVDDKNKFLLKNIVKNYKILYKNIKGDEIFINESGLYQLIRTSNSTKANDINNWIESKVLPSLRKYGKYRLDNSNYDEIERLNKELSELKAKLNKINYKIIKYKTIQIVKEYTDENEILKLKSGKAILTKTKFKAKDLAKRKNTIDTSLPYRSQVLKSIVVEDKEAVESCLKNKMREFAIIGDKEFFECTYAQIIDQLAICIKFYEGIDIDKTPDNDAGLTRLREADKIPPFDVNKKMKIYFENDDDDDFEDSDSDHSVDSVDSIESDVDTDDNTDAQRGGFSNENFNKMMFLKYKVKYLTLLQELK